MAKGNRWITGAAAAAIMVIMLSAEVMAAPENWKQDNKGWWYQKEDGTFYKDAWAEEDGAWYHFDQDGYRDTGWLEEESKWYYLGEDGRMTAGTSINIDGAAYTFDSAGVWIGNALSGVYPGFWQGNVFTNTWADYKLTLPENGVITDPQVMRDIRADTFGEIEGKAMDSISLTEAVIDMPEDGAALKISYQSGSGIELLELEEMTKVLIQLYGTTGYLVEQVSPAVIGGHNYNRIALSAINGIVKMDIYVRKAGNSCMTIEAAYINGYGDGIQAVINGIVPAV